MLMVTIKGFASSALCSAGDTAASLLKRSYEVGVGVEAGSLGNYAPQSIREEVRLAEEARLAEEVRLAEEARIAAEVTRLTEEVCSEEVLFLPLTATRIRCEHLARWASDTLIFFR